MRGAGRSIRGAEAVCQSRPPPAEGLPGQPNVGLQNEDVFRRGTEEGRCVPAKVEVPRIEDSPFWRCCFKLHGAEDMTRIMDAHLDVIDL